MTIFRYFDHLEAGVGESPRVLYLYIATLTLAFVNFVDAILDAQNYYAGEPSKLAQADLFRMASHIRPSLIFIVMSIFWLSMGLVALRSAERIFRSGK